jgi:hypothetical protein
VRCGGLEAARWVRRAAWLVACSVRVGVAAFGGKVGREGLACRARNGG